MKTNKNVGTLILSTLTLSALTTTTFAAPTTTYEEDLNKSSEMQVNIGTTDGGIDPEVDPTKPVIDPPEVIKGQIGISQVSPLLFEDVQLTGKKITTSAQFYSRANEVVSAYKGNIETNYVNDDAFPQEAITPSIQVLDARGTAEGWRVSAKVSELKAGEVVMKGAELIYNAPKITSTIDNTDVAMYPVASENKVVINADGSTKDILNAKKGTGAGTFYMRYTPKTFTIGSKEFKNTPIELNVPSATKKGNYTGTVTYTLTPLGDIVAAD